MTIFTNLLQENAIIKTELYRFIADYEHLHDEERMRQVGNVLQLLNHTMELKMNKLFPIVRNKTEFSNAIKASSGRYEDISDIMEKMVNIHVDEPHKQFKERAEQILALFEDQTRHEENELFPQLDSRLTLDERETLGRILNLPVSNRV